MLKLPFKTPDECIVDRIAGINTLNLGNFNEIHRHSFRVLLEFSWNIHFVNIKFSFILFFTTPPPPLIFEFLRMASIKSITGAVRGCKQVMRRIKTLERGFNIIFGRFKIEETLHLEQKFGSREEWPILQMRFETILLLEQTTAPS